MPEINKQDGHQVKIIASTETYVENSQLGYVKPGKYFTKDGIEIERVPYRKYLPLFIMKKTRHYYNVYNLIAEFSPDVILFHGLPAYELLTVAKYKRNNPDVKFYVDSHEDRLNSGRNWVSKNILHKLIYKTIINKAYQYIDKILYITYETKVFIQQTYGITDEKLEYFPLGGNTYTEKERVGYRSKIRKQLGLKENDILLIHSGKLHRTKNTQELLRAFLRTNSKNLKLVIIGTISKDQKDIIDSLIAQDERISYLGWKSSDELLKYLTACDLYVQPAEQSVTMQNALCCGSVVAVYPYLSHTYLLGNVAFYIKTIEDMVLLFNKVVSNRKVLEDKRAISFSLASEKLDYRKLASRLYQ